MTLKASYLSLFFLSPWEEEEEKKSVDTTKEREKTWNFFLCLPPLLFSSLLFFPFFLPRQPRQFFFARFRGISLSLPLSLSPSLSLSLCHSLSLSFFTGESKETVWSYLLWKERERERERERWREHQLFLHLGNAIQEAPFFFLPYFPQLPVLITLQEQDPF